MRSTVAIPAAALAVLLMLAAGCTGGDDGASPSPSSSTSSSSSSVTPTTSTVSETQPVTTTEPLDASTAVFPTVESADRFPTPEAAAEAFAVDYVGMVNPIVGGYRAGDTRSGEIEVRPRAAAQPSTVIVRQLDDGNWWVLGAAMENIRLDEPAAGTSITSPVRLTGAALAFEGHVDVEIRADGTPQAIGKGFVTGGGDVITPFEGSVEFTAPRQPYGAVVLLTRSALDGSVADFVVVRIAF